VGFWTRQSFAREPLDPSELDLIRELLRIRARLHRLDIATALLLTQIEADGGGEDPLGGLVDARNRKGVPS
jgi:hypothetical protein